MQSAAGSRLILGDFSLFLKELWWNQVRSWRRVPGVFRGYSAIDSRPEGLSGAASPETMLWRKDRVARPAESNDNSNRPLDAQINGGLHNG